MCCIFQIIFIQNCFYHQQLIYVTNLQLPVNIKYSNHPLITSLPPTTLFLWDQISDTTKLYPSREDTPFMRPLFHCRKGGLTRGGMLSFNSNMTGTTSGAGTLYSSWTLEFTPSLSLIVTWLVPQVEQELFLNPWVHSQFKLNSNMTGTTSGAGTLPEPLSSLPV